MTWVRVKAIAEWVGAVIIVLLAWVVIMHLLRDISRIADALEKIAK